MITLHRLNRSQERFQLNPDLIVSIESTPDTVITLATAAKVVVSDTPEQIAEAIRHWRAQVLSAALGEGSERPQRTAPWEGAPQQVRSIASGRTLAAIEGGGR